MLQIQTSSGKWEKFCKQILDFLRKDIICLNIDGRLVRGFRSPDSPSLWIRDHSDILRAGRYIEADALSAIDGFAATQGANGRIFDFVQTTPLQNSTERENWEKWVRAPVEADVEYRFVKAAYLAWQATGDHDWLQDVLPHLNRALTYTASHSWRWDGEHGLVKRPYTIDTWDFDYTAGRTEWLNFQINKDTYWGIFHGDNSGFYEAIILLSKLYDASNAEHEASKWRQMAGGLRERANRLLFNGCFYKHFHKLKPVKIAGCDEVEQLSLSNPMAINRGLATHEMAAAILGEYQLRRQHTDAFAEWFGIDPPFPDGVFGDPKLRAGAYINGGIFPLTGGELARAAFEHGFEEYGLQTLEQYRRMIAESNASYLWYFPSGEPASVETSTSPEASPTDGWGSSAMLFAFIEGLCGVEDSGCSFQQVRCSPRWTVTEENDVRLSMAYAASGASFGYHYQQQLSEHRLHMKFYAQEADVDLHFLLPTNRNVETLLWDGRAHPFTTSRIENSEYLDATGSVRGETQIEIQLTDDAQP